MTMSRTSCSSSSVSGSRFGCARCEREGKSALAQLPLEVFQEAVKAHGPPSVGIGKDLYDALGARNVVNRYRSAGAAGGEPFKQQLAEWKARLGM